MAIIKRRFIDNSIFKELNEKYPPVNAKNGVAYKQKLDYLTFEPNFLSEPSIRELRKKYNSDLLEVIFCTRQLMCNDGWRVRVDGSNYDYLLEYCKFTGGVDEKCADMIIQDLLENNIFYVVSDEDIEVGQWLTCAQQIYNYEMACNKRRRGRDRQNTCRANKKQNQEQQPVVAFQNNYSNNQNWSYACDNNVNHDDTDCNNTYYDPFELFN
ncbi:MAG: hypothetical protein J1E98_01115 [Lachnospiraceae bacterium]|nr:hypothetical protein [Lachnospiraceae bacterium]